MTTTTCSYNHTPKVSATLPPCPFDKKFTAVSVNRRLSILQTKLQARIDAKVKFTPADKLAR